MLWITENEMAKKKHTKAALGTQNRPGGEGWKSAIPRGVSEPYTAPGLQSGLTLDAVAIRGTNW